MGESLGLSLPADPKGNNRGHEHDCGDPAGCQPERQARNPSEQSGVGKARHGDDLVLVVCNFSPQACHRYRIGVPRPGFWKEILNSDAQDYGGTGQGNMGGVEATPDSFYGKFEYTLSVTLPPLGIVIFKKQLSNEPEPATPPADAKHDARNPEQTRNTKPE